MNQDPLLLHTANNNDSSSEPLSTLNPSDGGDSKKTAVVTAKKEEEEDEDDEEEEPSYDGSESNDEFYDEMMDTPAELEDFLIPNDCKDVKVGLTHLTACLQQRYDACPVIFDGPLEEALKESLGHANVKERRPLLIYVHNDKSTYTNLFCKQVLCAEPMVDFLLANCVLFAWDVTFESNKKMFLDMCSTALGCSLTERVFCSTTSSLESYPLLVAVMHNATMTFTSSSWSSKSSGDYACETIVSGSKMGNKEGGEAPSVDLLVARLVAFKDRFEQAEEELAKPKPSKMIDAIRFPSTSTSIFDNMRHWSQPDFEYGGSRRGPHQRKDHAGGGFHSFTSSSSSRLGGGGISSSLFTRPTSSFGPSNNYSSLFSSSSSSSARHPPPLLSNDWNEDDDEDEFQLLDEQGKRKRDDAPTFPRMNDLHDIFASLLSSTSASSDLLPPAPPPAAQVGGEEEEEPEEPPTPTPANPQPHQQLRDEQPPS